ncbi:(2Fe-2S)-binding protein [Kibdelosporangium persicum]|uniref:Isoquinoline 1-oxidoreductase alpha subunit IorA n=1 Tax=Kibdelosporangium persicum TaxID=2698649 RepID=A0ABX2F4F0_9PSEU|nr:(2Fe-2S)-binding protein [Kibdelosporangium persicum]NRN66219.1 Isoquinoline 1-oxidoreductase alpha subunit IorA [Kibdelosporangium persicum]
MTLRLTVNDQRRRVETDPETPLLWVIREQLGLTGTKFGCGAGVCGACTVQLDGKPVQSCSVPVGDVGRQPVTTIEGVDGPVAEAVRRAWLELDAAECGYCQPGMIVAAIALLRRKPHCTDKDIDDALRGNICRCGIYDRIRAAVHLAARKLER